MKTLLSLTALLLTGVAGAQMAESAPMPMSAAEHRLEAMAYAAQAEVAYPQAFYDRTLWKAAVDHAYLAHTLAPGGENTVYLAQLYTQTQWWINAYRTWKSLGDVPMMYRPEARRSAQKLAALARARGDLSAAAMYGADALMWR